MIFVVYDKNQMLWLKKKDVNKKFNIKKFLDNIFKL